MSDPNSDDRLKIVIEIIKKITKNKLVNINESSTAREVDGWDSLAHMAIILEIEKYFSLRFRATEVASLSCVGDLLHIINAKLDDN